MNTLIKEKQSKIIELLTLQGQMDFSKSALEAFSFYRKQLCKEIEEIYKPEFEKDDRVELTSSSYEDGNHFSGDTGLVKEAKFSVLPSGHVEEDIRVEWDNGADTCWISAEDFVNNSK